MGHGFTISCKNCGYEKEIMVGIGKMYFRLENVVDQLPKSEQKIILDILKQHHLDGDFIDDFVFFENKLYVCRHCVEFSDDLHVRIKHPLTGKFLYLSKHRCKKCKSRMKNIAEKAFTRYPCPKCKSMELTESGYLLWD